MAMKRNLDIEQGAHFELPMRFKDTDGAVVDVSAWSFAAQFRETHAADAVQASMEFDMTGAADGLVIGYIPDESTAAMVSAKGVWDLEYDTGDGKRKRLFEGKYKLSMEVTRDV